ncbi:unnamed protein product [Auanema sp. JU1783]|nr:unnamed protein product [Auanema sp. JU1783]
MEPPVTRRQSVRRCLFGKPNKQKVDEWLTNELSQINKEKSEKWSFDFVAGRPFEDGEIEFEKLRAAEVPSVYRPSKRCPRVRLDVASTSKEPSGPKTRSFSRRELANDSTPQKECNLKQAKLTNYLTVRKRRSLDAIQKKSQSEMKNKRVDPPGSPFRFVSKDDESAFECSSSVTSPRKSPIKRRNGRSLVLNGVIQTKRM